MSIEKKVYPAWAYSKNGREKSAMNTTIYNELCRKYNIAFGAYKYNSIAKRMEPIDFNAHDIVIESSNGYAHMDCSVLKNNTRLSNDEIALICDRGNLCFGYRGSGDRFQIYTD